MKTTLTREEIFKAQEAFDCKDWRNNIQEILDSTIDENIEIEEKYLDLIKDKATWKEILFCKSLNLDLKWNLPQEAKEWILEKIRNCEVIKKNEFRTLYQENGKTLFVLNSETKIFCFSHDGIEQISEKKYYLKYNEIRELMDSILGEYLKLEGYIPSATKYY